MKNLKVLFLVMFIMTTTSPANAVITGEPCIHVDKTVEPTISKVGDDVLYTIEIYNCGDIDLTIVDIFDDRLGPIPIPPECEVLPDGNSCSLTVPYSIQPEDPNPLVNEVCVTAFCELGGEIVFVSDCNTASVFLVEPDIYLQKIVEPNVACPGETVIYTIFIENNGDWPLENVEVVDPLLSPIYGSPLLEFPPVMFPGEIYLATFPYMIPEDAPVCPDVLVNWAEVTAKVMDLPNIIDANDSAEVCCEPPGDEGCTPGFWKNNGDKHGASVWCDDLAPSTRFSDVFILDEPLIVRGKGRSTITDPTLLEALNANGGGVNAMIRHGVAALLNACSDNVNYPINEPLPIILMIEDTLNEIPGAYTVDELHATFADWNEAGCPVDQHGECAGVED